MVGVQYPADPGYSHAQYLLPHHLEPIVKCYKVDGLFQIKTIKGALLINFKDVMLNKVPL